MALIQEEDKKEVLKFLEGMEKEVVVHLFLSDDCQTCDITKQLNEEIASLSEKIKLEQHSFDDPAAEKYGARDYGTKAPAAIITNDTGISGVRFFGIPSGHEFMSYLYAILHVSTGKTDLDEKLVEEIKKVDKKTNIKVFITTTCPHCPRAVMMAHQMAIINPNIQGDMIEAQEYMELSQEYNVMSVPQININDKKHQFIGAYPPQQYWEEVKKGIE